MPLELTLTEEELLSLKSATTDADEQKSDLSLLSDVNAGSVLHNLRQRYELQEIYTSIGPQILIAVNPFEPLPVCGEDFMLELQGRESADLPPHATDRRRRRPLPLSQRDSEGRGREAHGLSEGPSWVRGCGADRGWRGCHLASGGTRSDCRRTRRRGRGAAAAWPGGGEDRLAARCGLCVLRLSTGK